jgi:hypothetical protein
MGWFPSTVITGGRKPTYLISATSVLTSVKADSIGPSGGNKTDVRWVGSTHCNYLGAFDLLVDGVGVPRGRKNTYTAHWQGLPALFFFVR